jgi:hypothetical protein
LPEHTNAMTGHAQVKHGRDKERAALLPELRAALLAIREGRTSAGEVALKISDPAGGHWLLRELQTLLLCERAIALIEADSTLSSRLFETLDRWNQLHQPFPNPVWNHWRRLIETYAWDQALETTEKGHSLRRASPLQTVVDESYRLALIRDVGLLRKRLRAI